MNKMNEQDIADLKYVNEQEKNWFEFVKGIPENEHQDFIEGVSDRFTRKQINACKNIWNGKTATPLQFKSIAQVEKFINSKEAKRNKEVADITEWQNLQIFKASYQD